MGRIASRAATAAVFATTALAAGPAAAVEGVVQYPHGASGFMVGALPPPGTHALGYLVRYDGILQDENGDDLVNPLTGDEVEIGLSAFAVRLVHMTDIEILGGRWGVQAVAPFFRTRIDSGSVSDINGGLGDVTIDPFLLAWRHGDLFWSTGLDIVLPTGEHDPFQLVNLGANYFTFEPILAVTWLPGDGWQLNAKFMFNFKLENPDTNYRSGNEFHMDWTIGKEIADGWTLGIGGYYVRQVEDDEQNGRKLPGTRNHVVGIGPQVMWQAADTTRLIVKWHHEPFAEHAFQGDRFLLKAVHSF